MTRPLRLPAPGADGSERQVALPKVPCDPLASLPPVEILVDCGGRTWIIPALTADYWLKALWTAPFDPDSIFPGYVTDSEVDDVLLDAYLAGEVSLEETSEIAMEALEIASGFPWWFTLKLVTVFSVSWSRLGGMLINAGIDARSMSLGAWCSSALEMCVSNLEPSKAAELIEGLLMKPEGYGPEVDPFDEVEDSAAFLEAMHTVF